MKKLTVLAATLLLSSTAFAGSQTFHRDTNVTTDAFATKAAAYDAGFAYIDNLQQLSDVQLRFELPTQSDNGVSNVQLADTQVTIQEFAKSRGEIAYRAVINVDYSFVADQDND